MHEDGIEMIKNMQIGYINVKMIKSTVVQNKNSKSITFNLPKLFWDQYIDIKLFLKLEN